jgi:DNA-binding PadR family transcriptional regulator
MTEQKQGNRLKKYYKATELGKAAFLEWLSSPYDINTGNEVHLAQVYFLGELPTELRIKRLQEHEFYLQQMLQQLQAVEKQLSNNNLSDRDYFELSTFYFSYQLLQNTIRWLGYIRERKPLSSFMSEIGRMGDLK